MRVISIGDIHGMLNPLKIIWKELNPSKNDKIIFLGDLIDRGPNSREVIDFVISKIVDGFDIISLRGNHEEMLLAFINKNGLQIMDEHLNFKELEFTYRMNGGNKTINQYINKNGERLIPSEHLKYLKNTKMLYEWNDYIFVHAGINPEKKLENQIPSETLWIRENFIEVYNYKYISKRVIFGHTPTTYMGMSKGVPFIEDIKIGIDTGCVFGGKLTALILPDMKFVQV